MKNKTALICGISGQDGSLLAQLLLSKGYCVHGTSRDAELTSFHNLHMLGKKDQIKLHSLSLKDFGQVWNMIEKIRPDEIYNLSGQTSVGLSFTQPIETMESISIACLNLLEVCRTLNYNPKVYFAGSSEMFGEVPPHSPADESTRLAPISPYGVAKAAAHLQISAYREAYGLFACSGILFNHESPLRPGRFVTKKIVRAACEIAQGSANKLKLGNIDIIRDWGWAPDYVNAMWKMLQEETADDFVIASGKSHSLRDFIEKVFAYLGLNWEDHIVIDETLFRSAEIHANYASILKARNTLNWKTRVSFDEMIKRLVDAELTACEAKK